MKDEKGYVPKSKRNRRMMDLLESPEVKDFGVIRPPILRITKPKK